MIILDRPRDCRDNTFTLRPRSCISTSPRGSKYLSNAARVSGLVVKTRLGVLTAFFLLFGLELKALASACSGATIKPKIDSEERERFERYFESQDSLL